MKGGNLSVKIEADKTDLKQRTGPLGHTKKQDLRVKKGPSGQKKDLRVITKEKDLRVKKGPSGHKQRTGHLVLNWLEETK